jgi:hypothetical protein
MMTAVLIALFTNAFNAQTLVGFESLTVPESGYFNGSTVHSGTFGSTETFLYAENGVNFYVTYTLEESYDYWGGFAYSNQTDLETADWTNYSAYANPAGGATGSENYIFAYSFSSDSVMFDNPVNIISLDIANTVWAYKYMTGEDGSGNAFTSGDYLKLEIFGINPGGSLNQTPVSVFLGQNTTILNNWTTIDLTTLGPVSGLLFSFSSSDIYAPSYFCLDNIVYSEYSSIEYASDKTAAIYPNPANNRFAIRGIKQSDLEIVDLKGESVLFIQSVTENSPVNIASLKPGMYLVKIYDNNEVVTKKLWIYR